MSERATINIAQLLDEAPFSRLQFAIVFFCACITVLDGFDQQAIGYTAPSIASAFGLAVSSFGPIIAATQVGFVCGAFLFAPFGDRFGRRWVLITATIMFGIFTALMTLASSLALLIIDRFFIGLGIGISLPLAVSLASEFTPRRIRGMTVTFLCIATPFGGMIAGFISSAIIPAFGWQPVYYIGGLAPLLLAVALVAVVPESPGFLVNRGAAPEQIAGALAAIVPNLPADPATRFEIGEERLRGFPVAHLFRGGRGMVTLLLWGAFFCDYMIILFTVAWTPALLREAGIPISQAALLVAFNNIGGMIGGLSLGRLIDRFGPYLTLTIGFTCGAALIGSLGFVASSFTLACAVAACAGFCIGGGSAALVALATITYPTAIRSTGLGWANGAGRAGAVVGPIIAGVMLGWHMRVEMIFIYMGVPMLCAAAFVLTLGFVRPAWMVARADVAAVR